MTHLADLAALPFQPQLDAISAWLDARQAPSELVEALATYPDHEPLAWAVRALARGPAERFEEAAPTLRALLPGLSDAALQRVLRALGHQDLDSAQLARAAQVLWGAWEQLGLGRIAAFCLLDRWLKNADPVEHQARQEALRGRLVEALSRPDGDLARGLDDGALLRASGRWWGELGALAQKLGRAEAWEARLRGHAESVVRALQGLPRSLSQANAEELLSKRIYTDPGHFLVELLQNAEDCGAGRFWVGVGEAEAWVWHDGAPFDAKDVVGVLSIGQSTKGRGQIGFFGVGFKAVYEVCERPRVYSEVFSFEIADVSIPRQMGARPRGPWPDGGTLLVLPWRAGLDATRSPARLLERARAVPAEVLLTLRHIREVCVYDEGLGGQRWRSAREDGGREGELRLLVERGEARELRRYQRARGFVEAAEGTRERARAARSEVLVAVRLDAQTGAPVRMGVGEPEVYNHLPTRELSGLGWLVHAAFDQPVDRERLDLGSAWNRALLREAGRAAPQVFAALLAGGADGGALLDLIPTREEARDPAWAGLREALVEGARALPLLPGGLACGEARVVLDAALARALDGATWRDGRRCCDLEGFAGASQGRRWRVARELGAVGLDAHEALEALREDGALLARLLGEGGDGRWEALHAWLEGLPRASELGLGAVAWFPREGGGWGSLRGQGGCWVAPAGAWGAWVRGLEGRPALVSEAFAARFEGWLRRLGARVLDLEAVVAQVEAGELLLEGEDLGRFHRGLAGLAQDVTPRQRDLLARARVWPRADGARCALGELRRAAPSPAWERAWALVSERGLWGGEGDCAAALEALGLGAQLAESSWAGLWGLVGSAALRRRVEQAQDEAWVAALRASLAALGGELRARPAVGSAALETLPLWPTVGGGRAAPSSLVRGRALRAEGWMAGLAQGGELGWLGAEAEEEAEALEGVVRFRSPAELVVRGVCAQAKVGEALEAQPAPLDRVEGVARLAAWLWGEVKEEALALPLCVDARGRLVKGPKARALDGDEAWLCEVLGLEALLSDARWASLAQAIDPRWVPSVPVGRVCAELARQLRAGEAGAALAQPARLYRWIEARRADLEADEQALGSLGQAPLVKTEAGGWREPRAVLWGSAGSDEGLGLEAWRCGAEVPEGARAWFKARFAWEEASLHKLLGALVELHKEAQSRQDGARSARLWGAMAAALQAEQAHPQALGRAVERHKLHRLRVEGRAGEWERPEHFLARADARSEWLDHALGAQVPALHGAYEAQGAGARRLLEAAGARLWWDADALMAAVVERRGVRPGVEAAAALARYVACWAVEGPGGKQAARLREVAWVPDGAGACKAPKALYWPGPDLEALLGERPELRPHPAFFHAAPPQTQEVLGFLDAREARLEDVLGPWSQGEPRALPAAVLAWVEGRLRQRLASGEEVRRWLRGRPALRDDEGALRPPEALICTPAKAWLGARRAVWSEGLRWSKLASVLDIPRQVGVAEALEHGAWLGARLEELGAAQLMALDPACVEQAQRCSALLVERGVAPSAGWPLAVLEPSGEVSLRRLDDPAVRIWGPARLHEEAERRGVKAATPWSLDEAQREALEAWLLAAGVKDLRWSLGEIVENKPEPATEVATEARAEAPRADARRPPSGSKKGPPPAQRATQEAATKKAHEGAAKAHEGAAKAHASEAKAHASEAKAHEGGPPSPAEGGEARAGNEAEAKGGLWGRLKRWFGGEEGHQERADEETKADKRGDVENKDSKTSQGAARGSLSAPSAPKGATKADPSAPIGDASAPKTDSSAPKTDSSAPKTDSSAPKGDLGGGAFRPSDHSRWFRPGSSVEAQLEGAPSWVQDRARRPEFGFSFRPTSLPWPHRYAVRVLGVRFERATQRWVPSPTPPEWFAGGAGVGAEVSVRGRVPGGENLFPLPMYARWGGASLGAARWVARHEGGGVLWCEEAQHVEARVFLEAAPSFEGLEGDGALGALDARDRSALLERTVPDAELPDEVLRWVEGISAQGAPPLERAKAVQAFIQARYRYDPSYLEDSAEARRRLRLVQGSAHLHLAALHADRDGRHLGRGVCHEFGALACELLRRVGVPAAVATGWTWDRGQLAEADHMWAMALLPSDLGLRWAPIDAATTREGRPLHHGARPPGAWSPPAPKSAAPLPQEPAWTRPTRARWDAPQGPQGPQGPRGRAMDARGARDAGGARDMGGSREMGGTGRTEREVAESLALVVRYAAQRAGQPVPDDLRARCEGLLRDPSAAQALWSLLGLEED